MKRIDHCYQQWKKVKIDRQLIFYLIKNGNRSKINLFLRVFYDKKIN